MRSSLVILYVASAFTFASHLRAAALSDEVFADGFEYRDFPEAPIVDPSAPTDAAALFGAAAGAPTGGPCLADPQIGTLFPNNWLRPRFTWVASSGENLFELRVSAQNQANALVVYTAATTWTMSADIWAGLSQHTVDEPITVTVRGATYAGGSLTNGPALGSSGAIRVAPVPASGAIVYWTSTSGGMLLRGFRIGDENLEDIVSPAGGGTACVGCHSATPDGTDIGFSASNSGGVAAMGLLSSNGQQLSPDYVSASAQSLMARQDQQAPVFSKLHWTAGDRVALTMYESKIMWTDLEATSTAQGAGWDFLSRTGETANAASASFAHTSDTVLYAASPSPVSQGVTITGGDLETVPYNNRAGGTPTPVAGAATPENNEYYPVFSPDDTYIAYNRVPAAMSSYNNAEAEVYVIPSVGGSPVRIAANDPPACTGAASPGITNSWPRWSPDAHDNGGRRFYWLTFSSTRSGTPQIYVAPVVDNGSTLITYPALYPWNQNSDDIGHTPAWGNFSIPF